jgi:thioredoxin 1
VKNDGHKIAPKYSKMEVVYIGATWCGTCKLIKPSLDELCKKFSVPIKVLDYDNDLTDAEQEDISKVPTVRIFKDGKQVEEYNFLQVQSTEEWLKKNVQLTACEDF